MARKSAKQARLDVMGQRGLNRLKKEKLHAKRKDTNLWGERVLKKLKVAVEEKEKS